jgi:ferrochelatase
MGVLLINLGTPDSPNVSDVRRYLREFLSDPRVLTMPAPLRWLLLNAVILPFRPRRSAAAYRSIWTPEGSPLLHFGSVLRDDLGKNLGGGHIVALGMRYGSPSIEVALQELLEAGVREIVTVPLFPQYASASTGSALARLGEVLGSLGTRVPVRIAPPFFDHQGFIRASVEVARPLLDDFVPDHVLFSFHGLPESQVRDLDPTASHCLVKSDCCDNPCPANRSCYRAQCFATARALEGALDLPAAETTVAFQSRLGRAKWLEPDLTRVLPDLAARGTKRVAVMCPAFVADCLETVEEIGMRAREQWAELGGEALCLVPCVNAHPSWVEGLARIVRDALAVPATANAPLT